MAAGSARNSTNVRLYLLAAMLFLWGGAICLRLVYLQIFRYGSFELRAQHQQQRTTEVSARRGIIYDRAGHELAMSIAVDSVFAVPTEIPDLAGTISLISRITTFRSPRTPGQVPGRPHFLLVSPQDRRRNRGPHPVAESARHLFPKGIQAVLPQTELAAQVIGYVGTDDEGLSGIEREYDDKLRGKPGEMLVSVDARRKWFGSVEKQPEPGQNVVLTIDQQIQYIAERELQTAMEQTHAEAGTVIVENPHTGEILALANQPTFNPNLTREITPAKTEEPCGQRCLRAGLDVQGGHHLRRA